MKRFDLQDGLLVAGVVLIVAGIGAWSRPAAAIALGCFCLAFVRLIARVRAQDKPEGKI
jgi:hypothetical protein